MGLGDYTIFYSGGIGSAPSSRSFAELGVTSAKIVSVAGGGDYAEITVDVNLASQGMPFVPLARHAIYDDGHTLRFVGWLMQPGYAATADRQQQTFRLEGPMSRLTSKVFQQPWNFAINPTSYTSDLAAQVIPRVLLNLEDVSSGVRVNVRAQIEEVLIYYIGLYGTGLGATAPITYGSLAAIPACQPPEDEQTDAYCDAIIQRQLRWVPKVTAYWTYPPQQPLRPVLNFSANDAVPSGSIVGNVAIVPGRGLVPLTGYTSILIDPLSGTLTSFKSTPRYDLLVGKVTVYYQSEQDVPDDGSGDGTRKLWATLASEVSTAANGSDKELTYCFDLRGAGGPRDPATGLPRTPQESVPTGLASAFHDPFKVLTHSLEWSVVGEDVDWSVNVGAAVGVRNGGDDLLLGSRSILQQITRDIGTGTTSYQAGPPTQLGMSDLVSLTRFNKTRNSGRNAAGGGQYSFKGGPEQKKKGVTTPPGGGGGTTGTGTTAAMPNDFSLYNATAKHVTAGGLWVGVRFGMCSPGGELIVGSGVKSFPNVFGVDGSTPWEFQVTASGLAYLHVTITGAAPPVSFTANSAGYGPTRPDDTSTDGYWPLGYWSVADGKLTILNSDGLGSQAYTTCGGAHYFDPARQNVI